MAITIRFEGRTDTGRQRRRNEDAWGAAALDSSAGGCLLVVADGMGGHPGGDVASRIAVESCLEGLRSPDLPGPGPQRIAALFREARSRLRDQTRLRPDLLQMGTTLTLLLVQEDGIWAGSIGDSRLLWQRGRVMRLVTEDHNVAWQLVLAGQLDADEAERAPEGAMLTRFLSPVLDPEPDIPDRPLEALPGDRLLLCTDGLGKVLAMGEIASTMAESPLSRALDLAIDRSLIGGAPDNVTLLLAEVLEPPAPEGRGILWDSFPYAWGADGGRSH